MLPTDLTNKYLCIVEGTADEKIFKKLSASPDVIFDSPNQDKHGGFGKDAFHALLQGLVVIRGFADAKGLIIIQDSDNDPEIALKEIQTQVLRANREVKKDGREFGIPQSFLTVTYGRETPPVMALSIPWIDKAGSLESLFLEAAESLFPELKVCVDRFIECVGGLSGWTTGKMAKSRLACIVAATIKTNPTAAVHMIHSNREFTDILNHASFAKLRELFSTLDSKFT